MQTLRKLSSSLPSIVYNMLLFVISSSLINNSCHLFDENSKSQNTVAQINHARWCLPANPAMWETQLGRWQSENCPEAIKSGLGQNSRPFLRKRIGGLTQESECLPRKLRGPEFKPHYHTHTHTHPQNCICRTLLYPSVAPCINGIVSMLIDSTNLHSVTKSSNIRIIFSQFSFPAYPHLFHQ